MCMSCSQEAALKVQFDVEVTRRVSLELAKARSEFDSAQRNTERELEEATRAL